MKDERIIALYFEGYTVNQIAKIIYENNRTPKGKPMLSNKDALYQVEHAVISELQNLNKNNKEKIKC